MILPPSLSPDPGPHISSAKNESMCRKKELCRRANKLRPTAGAPLSEDKLCALETVQKLKRRPSHQIAGLNDGENHPTSELLIRADGRATHRHKFLPTEELHTAVKNIGRTLGLLRRSLQPALS